MLGGAGSEDGAWRELAWSRRLGKWGLEGSARRTVLGGSVPGASGQAAWEVGLGWGSVESLEGKAWKVMIVALGLQSKCTKKYARED